MKATNTRNPKDPQKENHNELHLFAGAGGGILGGILLGHTTVCAVECDPHARNVLLARQRDGCLPRFPIWDDVRTFDGKPWRGLVRTVCGGFPCQDISSAGGGAGITGERSGLWSEMRRVIGEIQPEYCFVENSPMLTIRGFGVVLGDLAAMGYNAAWGVLGAKHAGLAHHRERIWILAHNNAQRGRSLCGRPDAKLRNLGKHIPAISPTDRYMEELEGTGTKWKGAGNESGLPPYLCRVDDELANPVDRLARIGNGQVPNVAAMAWTILHDELMAPNKP